MDEVQDRTSMRLSNTTLSDLPEGVCVPTYDRSKLTAGIIHVGLGNFHRAHQAWYLHRLMQQGKAHDWAIIGAGVRAGDAVMRDKLLEQDCLTTLIELDPNGTSTEVIGSMIDFLPVEEDNSALVSAMADPAIRIVALTVTEGGYFKDASDGLDTQHPDILHDAANADKPRTVFGAMVAALRLRRDAGHQPFTGQCCDNLQHNGDILRQTVVGLARLSDPDLADWIDTHAAFPNAMVDCIVPATGPDEIRLAESIGIADAAPVTHENYRQWVIEDDFCDGRPAWEDVGATLTKSVHTHEAMKLKMLNAGHQILANAGELLGVPTIAACMGDARIADFFRKVQMDEIVPYVEAVPEITPTAYLDLIARRFGNPEIHDTTRRVAFDGSSRHPGFVLPILRDALAAGGSVEGLALTEALWARMCAGTRDDGSVIAPNDPHWDNLVKVAEQARLEPALWLQQSRYYDTLSENAGFASAFDRWLTRLWKDGTQSTLDHYIHS